MKDTPDKHKGVRSSACAWREREGEKETVENARAAEQKLDEEETQELGARRGV